MRRPRSVCAVTVALVLVVLAGACSHGDGGGGRSASTSTSTTATSVLPDAQDPALAATQVQASDLGEGFLQSTSSNNTVTSFCIGQDATQGLRATARAYVGFGRAPAGVLQLTFRFRKGDAERFVAQADQMFRTCTGVPDIQGHAYDYAPVSPDVEAVLAGTDGFSARYGVSVGNGNLKENAAFFRKGDIGVLIAVLTDQQDRAATDALARTAFTAAVRRAPAA
jgi:hypothetical protein